MLRTSVYLVATFVTLIGSSGAVHAQGRLARPERVGLEQVWSKAIPTGVGGKISGVHLHISNTEKYTASDVVDRYGRRHFFSDLGRTTISRGGYDQTQRRAAMKQAELAERGLEPRLETQDVSAAVLYVRSDSGMITAMNAESGEVLWATRAGKQGYPSFSVAASDEFVVALSSTKMFLLDAKDGQILDTTSIRSIPSGTPTLDGKYIYVPTWRGVIEVYDTEKFGAVRFTLGSTSPVVGTVTVCSDAISWATDAGYLYVGNRQRPGIKFRFESPDTISAAPAYSDGTLFAGSLDGFVYAIDDERGGIGWRYSAGGPIDESPLAIDDQVFATTRDGQLACLDTASGEPKWLASGIQRFLSVSTDRLYSVTTDNQLAVLDTATGSRIAQHSLGSAAVPFVNTATDRIYLASKSGVLTCLRETGRRWPITRQLVVPLASEEDVKNEDATEDLQPLNDVPSAMDEMDAPEAPEETGSDPALDAAGDDDAFSEFDDAGFGDMGAEDDPFEDF